MVLEIVVRVVVVRMAAVAVIVAVRMSVPVVVP
jgi:hypothetical protein